MKKSLIAIFLITCVVVFTVNNRGKWKDNATLKYDVSGYFVYLPALLIYQDIGELKFYPYLDSVYRPSDDIKNYAQYDLHYKNRKSNKYAIGTAIGELPLFLLAHGYTQYILSGVPPDGYSWPYQLSVVISNVIWLFIGLIILAIVLRRYYSDNIVAITLLIIGLGTNLFCYSTLEPGMSHVLGFMQFSLVLFFTERWYRRPKIASAAWLGIFLGWVIITRPVNFLVVIIPLLWPLLPAYRSRIQFFSQYYLHLLICIIGFLLVSSLQMGYWHYTTGKWLHFSYTEEYFEFSKPHLLEGLFSYRKGWFTYTPLAVAALLGFIPLFRQNRPLFWACILFFLPFVYVVFSWWNWWYGWGFGARAMIESYAVLAIPLVAILQYLSKSKPVIQIMSGLCIGFFIWLNIYQTVQYNKGALPGDNITKEFYWRVWNRLHPSPEDWEYLGDRHQTPHNTD